MERYATFYARIALGSAFLSAVAARFGLWDDRADPFGQFIRYTGEVNSFMPASTIPSLAIAATVAETFLGIALIAGLRLRRVALVSAVLLAVFGMAMTISFGIKPPLDASVFSASAGALLLARISHNPSAATADSGPPASLHSDFAPQHSVNYAFVAKSPCASHSGHSRLSRDEGL